MPVAEILQIEIQGTRHTHSIIAFKDNLPALRIKCKPVLAFRSVRSNHHIETFSLVPCHPLHKGLCGLFQVMRRTVRGRLDCPGTSCRHNDGQQAAGYGK